AYKGRTFVLVDTAGLRKKRQVTNRVEVFSAQRALRAVERADVVVVLTDATELGVEQDARIAAQAEERGRAVILCVNKWDLVRDQAAESKRLREVAARHLQHVRYAPLLFVSALTGARVQHILDVGAELHDQAATRLKTPELNDWMQKTQEEHPTPLWHRYGGEPGLEFFAGYLLEKSLSVDNLFVFVLLFQSFAVPPEHQHRVLFWGVLGALVLRGALIFAGVALVHHFRWVVAIFGA